MAYLGTPKWAVAELLLTIGMDLGTEGEPFAVDPEDPWAASALEEPESEGGPAVRLDSSDPDYAGHASGTVLLVLPSWNAGGPLPELLGDGWWRFLTPQGEEQILDAGEPDGESAAPSLWLLRMGSSRLLCEPGDPPPVLEPGCVEEGSVILREGGSKERIAGVHFMSRGPLDSSACQIMQSLGEVLRIAGVAMRRVQSSEESRVERVSVSLLLRDTAE